MKKLGLFTLSLVFLSTAALADNNNVAKNDSYETVTVVSVDRTGKPPYKRTYESFRVTDVALLELEESKNTPVKSVARAAIKHKN
ncbi:MAG: hypothetical protein ACI85N_002022 [Gammaproteobacteria bacterium]|jgi:hypothetical protein